MLAIQFQTPHQHCFNAAPIRHHRQTSQLKLQCNQTINAGRVYYIAEIRLVLFCMKVALGLSLLFDQFENDTINKSSNNKANLTT